MSISKPSTPPFMDFKTATGHPATVLTNQIVLIHGPVNSTLASIRLTENGHTKEPIALAAVPEKMPPPFVELTLWNGTPLHMNVHFFAAAVGSMGKKAQFTRIAETGTSFRHWDVQESFDDVITAVKNMRRTLGLD